MITPVTSAAQIAHALETFIRGRFQVASNDIYLDHHTDLWTEGYIDSLGIVELIQFMESSFQVSIPSDMLFDPDFVRISGMARLICQLADGGVREAAAEAQTCQRAG